MTNEGPSMKAIKRIISKIILKNKYENLALSQEQFLNVQRVKFEKLKMELANTDISTDLDLDSIHSYEEFVAKVRVRDYAEFKPYIEKLIAGQSNVLFNNDMFILILFRLQFSPDILQKNTCQL